jgi:hypothetical protein
MSRRENENRKLRLTNLNDCGFGVRSVLEHVLCPIEAGIRKPGNVCGRRCELVDGVTPTDAKDVCLIPHGFPEEVDVVYGPLIEFLVRCQIERVETVYSRHEPESSRAARFFGTEEGLPMVELACHDERF